jgi:phosphoribosylformimino-5-aminoimidazole carboxamide ribotide isomerase
LLGKWVSIPTTYAGGARSLADADLVNSLGHGKVDLTIGSALDIFGGTLAYSDIVKWNKENSDV